jgi:uncharacterized protein YegL
MENTLPTRENLVPHGLKRLAVYFLLDSSASMFGHPYKQAVQVAEDLIRHLRRISSEDLEDQAPIVVSTIIFYSQAHQLVPLTPIREYGVDSHFLHSITPGGASNMGAALRILENSIERELVLPGNTEGDALPYAILLTDEHPSDESGTLSRRLASLNRLLLQVVSLGDTTAASAPLKQILRERVRTCKTATEYYDLHTIPHLHTVLGNATEALKASQKLIARPAGYVDDLRVVALPPKDINS